MEQNIKLINEFSATFFHLEGTVLSFQNDTLVLAFSEDLCYYHEFELIFKNVFAITCNSTWTVKYPENLIEILPIDEQYKINLALRVEKGNSVFKLLTDDYVDLHIIAHSVELQKNMVKYDRPYNR